MAFAWDTFANDSFQLYRNQKRDEVLSHWGQVTNVKVPLPFNNTSTGIVDVWSDGRCYSGVLDAYVRPINSSASKSQGFPS